MKFSSLLLLLFSLVSSSLYAQKIEGSKAGSAMMAPVSNKYLGFRIPESDDVELLPELISVVSKNESEDQEALKELKAQKNAEKLAILAKANSETNVIQEKKTRGLDPVVVAGYNAIANNGTPSDNSCAVNKSNTLIAMVNSSMRVYNTTNGAGVGATINIDNFFGSLPNSANTCDPKVIYDQHSDRFIVFAQTCDGNSATSDILLAFSKTSDPAGGWYFYSFTGNPNGIPADVWFDYPKIGVSNHDVFITGNFFNDNMQYEQSGIYQIDKTKCYAGATLGANDAVVWYNIDNNPFTMVPMSNGIAGGYGNNMYLVSTGNSFTGNELKVYEITKEVNASPAPQLTVSIIPISGASSPGDAVQKGSSVQLNSGDNRGMDGFYMNGVLHYVFHCDAGGGFSGINYSRLIKSGSGWTISKNKVLKIANKDLAFPAIASFGYHGNDQGAIITCDYASSTDYPGIKAVYMDHFFTQSNFVEVKSGTGAVTILAQGGVTRWGDYSGISRVLNASKPTVWCFGMLGNSSNQWTNHFAQITTSDFPTGTTNVEEEVTKSAANVYPNPIVEDIYKVSLNLEEGGKLEMNLMDISGRFIRKIFSGNANKGDKIFTFNKGALESGNYIVNIKLNDKLIQNEKITVLHN